MTKRRVDRAIVLAAGRGSRLGSEDVLPKPLKPVAGVPLLVRILKSLRIAGIREAVIIVGFGGEAIRAALASPHCAEALADLKLSFCENPQWEKSNGVSLLSAREHIDRDCLLTMADHLIAPELVRRLLRAELPSGVCSLGVDYDIERCFDLDDATKVQVDGHAIADIGKTLERYNALDTGIFRITPALVESLDETVRQRGDASLSDGVRALARHGGFQVTDIGDARWIDVDTPEAHTRAEAMIRLFGESLEESESEGPINPDSMELFTPTWVRGATPYREDHFQFADRHRGGDLARLMSNESPFAPSARVVEAVLGSLMCGHRYPDASMARELRKRLTAGTRLSEEGCVLGAGSSEIIDMLVRTFVSPGEEVVVAVPTFSMYESRTRVAGGVPVLVPMQDDLELDVNGLVAAVTERTKLIFLCSPNNPTGRRVESNALRRILRMGIPVVVDEAYVEFGEDSRSVAGWITDHPNLIVVRTFSKAFGLAGLRIGYALCCDAVARLLGRVKLPWNVSTVAIAAAIAVLDDKATAARQREAFLAERRYLLSEFSRLPGVQVFASEGNFLLLDIHETPHTADALVQALLVDGVFIRSLGSHHLRRGYVRVSIGSHDENRRCVESLRRALSRQRGRTLATPTH